MSGGRLSNEEIYELYEELKISIDDFKVDSRIFSVWEIPPLKRGTRISTSTSLRND